MAPERRKKEKKVLPLTTIITVVFLLIIAYIILELADPFTIKYEAASVSKAVKTTVEKKEEPKPIPLPPLDKALYDLKMEMLANNPKPATTTSSTTPPVFHLWPVKTGYPKDGALLPFNRIVAYYGNFYSTKMGVLGEYDPDTMLAKLKSEVDVWKAADPETPVIPAIHYIAVTAQGSAGADGMYRLRMPDSEIDKALELAKQVDGIVFLDIQIGLSTFQAEIPRLEKYLKLPNVHLGLDPEFAMKTGAKPGTVIGTMDATEINYASNYLAKLVNDNNLPPKILVIHRFTQRMITNYQNIVDIPEVQVVIDMDGWGPPAQKINTYKSFVYPEPIEFTGFKLFYKNDIKTVPNRMLTPKELLDLRPRPIYIQYQ